eukprot:GGOE01056878.1.p2 GENE.GGOE01056878.1~~GGOE01056878.1.p2  ORF type:complete len:117 (+),score=7.70 GGOE01056878.1:280-630(+)
MREKRDKPSLHQASCRLCVMCCKRAYDAVLADVTCYNREASSLEHRCKKHQDETVQGSELKTPARNTSQAHTHTKGYKNKGMAQIAPQQQSMVCSECNFAPNTNAALFFLYDNSLL